MKKQLIRCAALALLALAFKGLSSFCHKETGGFTVLGVSSNRPYCAEWEAEPLSKEELRSVDAALDQKFHYLFSGGQAVVFLSEDNQYVIKFFDQRRFNPRFLARHLPRFFFNEKKLNKKLWKRENKLQRDFASYRLAFNELKEETGLMLVHLNQTDWIGKNVTLIDKLGIAHSLPIDQFEFVLQKRADLVYPRLEQLVKAGDQERAKAALSSLLDLFALRCQKGIDDSDPDLDKNFGFLGERAVQIDTGRFTRHVLCKKYEQRYLPPQAVAVLPPFIKPSFKTWLSELDPELLVYFDQEYARRVKAGDFVPKQIEESVF